MQPTQSACKVRPVHRLPAEVILDICPDCMRPLFQDTIHVCRTAHAQGGVATASTLQNRDTLPPPARERPERPWRSAMYAVSFSWGSLLRTK